MSNQNSGNLYIIATPIGNLKDITFRAVEILKSVDLILCEDTRSSKTLLDAYQISTQTQSYHTHNETKKTKLIINSLLLGKNIALISDAGTPAINDPGAVLVNQAHHNKIKTLAIGGISALSSALSVSGIVGDFIFKGFIPHKKEQRKLFLEQLMSQIISSIFFVGASRIINTVEIITSINPNQTIVLVKELSKIYEKTLKASAIEIQNWLHADINHQKGEFVIIIEKDEKNNKSMDELENIQTLKKVLTTLHLEGISVSQSAKIASKITKVAKNTCYKLSQSLNKNK